MAWIESHQALEKHRKVLRLAGLMDWTKHETIGRLHCLWWWCLDNALDGDLRHVSPQELAGAMEVSIKLGTRLLKALQTSGWVDHDQKPYRRVHDWWQYVGRYLKLKYRNAPDKYIKVLEAYSHEQSHDKSMSRDTLKHDSSHALHMSKTVDRTGPDLTNQKKEESGGVVHTVDKSRKRIPGEEEWAPIGEQVSKLLPGKT